MSRIERVSYRSGFVKRPREAASLPAITFEATDLPEDVVALVDEAFQAYLTKLLVLRSGVIADLKRKLSDRQVLDRPDLGQPASAARQRRTRGRRPRG